METNRGKMVAKVNAADRFPGMFQKEAAGLDLLRSSNSFKIPEVLGFGEEESQTYLLLEYLPSGKGNKGFWADFAEKLATLHRNSRETFGLDHDNYIGSLPQYNKTDSKNAAEFYVEKRLRPQIELAAQNGYRFKNIDRFYANLKSVVPDEKSALIHGDLWGGNYMVAAGGKPALFDPAVAFAPREMDIGMMHLFGGFPSEVFKQYHKLFPMEKGWESRVELWQLYYLLVHLNLFGQGYLSSVEGIISSYR